MATPSPPQSPNVSSSTTFSEIIRRIKEEVEIRFLNYSDIWEKGDMLFYSNWMLYYTPMKSLCQNYKTRFL